jgi:predicted RNase H-like HicB family nuclease
MATKMPVCLEVGSEGTGAFVPSCPGCWVFGRTPESAITKMKTAVTDWFEWLERHGEQIPRVRLLHSVSWFSLAFFHKQ